MFDLLTACGILTGFIVSLLSWQINIIALHRGFDYGRTAAFTTGLGAAIADCLLMVAGVTGAKSFLIDSGLWAPMKAVGAVMICLMALKILFHRPSGKIKDPQVRQRGLAGSLLIGVLIVAGNPAVILLWVMGSGLLLTHFPQIHSSGLTLLSFALSFFAGSVLWFTVLAAVLLRKMQGWGEKTLHTLSRFSAAALLAALFFFVFKTF